MDATKYLESYLDKKKDIELKQEELQNLKDELDKITQNLSFTSGAGKSNKSFANLVDQIEDLKTIILEEIKENNLLMNDIRNTIKKVPNSLQRIILTRIYILDQSIEDIAKIEHYTPQYIRNIKTKSINTMSEIINNNNKII